MENFPHKLLLLKQLSGKTNQQLAIELGVSILAFSNWINKKVKPRKKIVEKINKIFKEYSIETDIIYGSMLSEKQSVLEVMQKKNLNVLEKILKRQDLIDDISLRITYNSNAIEGSTMSMDDTYNVIFKKNIIIKKTLREQLEAKNHHECFLFLLNYINFTQNKIDLKFIKNLHKILMTGILENAGEFRNHPVRIVGSYVPTANYLKIENLSEDLFNQKLVSKNASEILNFVSKFHADLEKIHPFSDGNGRVGRLVLIAQLLKNDLAPAIIKTKNKPKYYKALQEAQLKEKFELIEEHILDAIFEGYKLLN